MKQIEELLRETMGLDAASIGSALIHRTARLRMKSLGLRRVEDYRQLLVTARAEWDELVESLVVTETWFFREREAFAALTRLVLDEWLPANPAARLRLLSLPCSSGEEPYSLAMAMSEAGLANGRFQIDAADISRRALAQALRGIYRKNSFRGEDLSFRDRHFVAGKEGFLLKPAFRQTINFHQWNVLAGDFLADRRTYDFIFCRNLLIYFDEPTQHRALQIVERLLSPAGVLFVGPAELPVVLSHGFVSAGIPMAFACRTAVSKARARPEVKDRVARMQMPPPVAAGLWDLHGGSAGKANKMEVPLTPTLAPLAPSTVAPELGRSDRGQRKRPLGTVASSGPINGNLETARRYADAGRLKEAEAICESQLRESGPSAEAYYLLGLVLDAQGSPKAADCYRKALYLEPGHYETLLQMALLSQRNGETVQAESFKRRARRISEFMEQ